MRNTTICTAPGCSSGEFANDGVGLLHEVGAPLHAAVLARSNRVGWPDGNVPADRAVRQQVDPFGAESRYDAVNAAWTLADEREGTLDTIVARFIAAHPQSFFN